MTPEELVEREAAWLHMRFSRDLPLNYEDRNEDYKDLWREDARSLNAMLNECGVRMVKDNYGLAALRYGPLDVQPLPTEAKEKGE